MIHMDHIKKLSWFWFICRESCNKDFVFSNRWNSPLSCIQSVCEYHLMMSFEYPYNTLFHYTLLIKTNLIH